MDDHTLLQRIHRIEEEVRLTREEVEADLRILADRASHLLQAAKRLATSQTVPAVKLDKALRMALQEMECGTRGVVVEGNGGGRVIAASVDLEHAERVVAERLRSSAHAVDEDREPEPVDV